MTTKKKTTTKKKELTFGEVWETLNAINVDDQLDKKGKFPFLPWHKAWAIMMEHYPQATFKNHKNDMEYPCFFDPSGFGMVTVTVSIDGLERTEDYAVTDSNYNAVQNPDPDDVNFNLKRCLVKCMAYFGLGQYVYRCSEAPQKVVPFDRDEAIKAIKANQDARDSFNEDDGRWTEALLMHFDKLKLKDLTDDQLQQVITKISNMEKKQNG
jgi:hypothetical protein